MSERAYVATRKGVFTIARNGGGKWSVDRAAFLGDDASIVLPDPRDGGKTLYVALGHGHFGVKMHRSDDAGETWKLIASPAYPPVPENEPPEKDFMGGTVKKTLDLVWSIEPGNTSDDDLWCGTIPGGLFHSGDRGESWRLVESLWTCPQKKNWFGGGAEHPGIHSICVHPRDPNHVAAGISCGGMMVTRDAGKTWQVKAKGMRADFMPPERQFDPTIQDPHRIAQCVAEPDKMWAQHHNGIFRTTDGGESWTEIGGKPSSFGFPVVVHPTNGDIAWFVPAIKDEQRIPVGGNVVVSRTSDGGKTFDVFNKGLPQGHAYDLVYRHAMDINETGERLIFGSTTGSLWISENGGEAWETISEHLPPIYCTRFV
jgi:hypothetical protein